MLYQRFLDHINTHNQLINLSLENWPYQTDQILLILRDLDKKVITDEFAKIDPDLGLQALRTFDSQGWMKMTLKSLIDGPQILMDKMEELNEHDQDPRVIELYTKINKIKESYSQAIKDHIPELRDWSESLQVSNSFPQLKNKYNRLYHYQQLFKNAVIEIIVQIHEIKTLLESE